MWDDITERMSGGEAFTLDLTLINGDKLSRCGLVGLYEEGLKVDHNGEWVWVPMASILFVTLEDL